MAPFVAAEANIASDVKGAFGARPEPQYRGFSNRMLDTTVALVNAK